MHLTIRVDSTLSISKNQCTVNQFNFLGIKHNFQNDINWDITDYGKLWNYNLQYFDYLLDEDIPIEYRKMLITKFSESILKKKIELEPYPVSLRIINTIIFNSRHQILEKVCGDALKIQIDYLRHNLEYHLLANHLLENLISLVISSYAINDKELNRRSLNILIPQLKEQTLTDGAHYERSPMYHCIILGRLLLCIDIMENNPLFENADELLIIKDTASKMLGWINSFCFPDGSFALMNDSTTGIAPDLSRLNAASSLLQIKSVPKSLTSSGFRKLIGSDFEVIMNVGNIMPQYQPGHTHADMLSFCFWGNGKNLIVDTGISTYENNEFRHYERSTLAHNTITIEQKNQSDVWGAFRVGKRAKMKLLEDSYNKIAGSISGFDYENSNIKHIRSFETKNDTLIIQDVLITNKENLYSSLHFNNCVRPEMRGRALYFDTYKITFLEGYDELCIKEYMLAKGFNNRVKSFKLIAKVQNKSSFLISKV